MGGSKAMRGLGAREFFHRIILVVGKVLQEDVESWNTGETTGADKIRAGVTWVTGECQSPRQIWRRQITAMRDAGWYLPSGSTGWRSSGLKAAVGMKEDIDPTSWPEEPGVGEDYREVMSPGNISDVSRKGERGSKENI